MGGTFIILQITWSVWYLLVTVAVLGSLGQELDPVLDLGHPGIYAIAGAFTARTHHSHLGESKYKMNRLQAMESGKFAIKLIQDIYNSSPSILSHHQRASRVSLAGVLDIVPVTGADVETK